MEICLSLGSNLGNRLNNLRRARRLIGAVPGVKLLASSAVYETEPVGVAREFQRKLFLNAVLVIEYPAPVGLLSKLRSIESAMGRVKNHPRNEPREIDIDVICAETLRVRQRDLVVPHPRWAQRRFVVRPLADVRPRLRVPGRRRTVAQILSSLPDTPKVVLFTRKW
jgi:2-amino-4-hydroxy-6-hydroxymethyldihydropteridine diphosphokinase